VEKNYPESFNKFWDKILNGKTVSKTKGARNIKVYTKDNNIILEVCGIYDGSYSIYNKEGFYCEMLDLYMFPRVKEYV
jgi:hypothetical protein